jgi:hypothetical protein
MKYAATAARGMASAISAQAIFNAAGVSMLRLRKSSIRMARVTSSDPRILGVMMTPNT